VSSRARARHGPGPPRSTFPARDMPPRGALASSPPPRGKAKEARRRPKARQGRQGVRSTRPARADGPRGHRLRELRSSTRAWARCTRPSRTRTPTALVEFGGPWARSAGQVRAWGLRGILPGEDLTGRQVVVLANLAPRPLRGKTATHDPCRAPRAAWSCSLASDPWPGQQGFLRAVEESGLCGPPFWAAPSGRRACLPEPRAAPGRGGAAPCRPFRVQAPPASDPARSGGRRETPAGAPFRARGGRPFSPLLRSPP
jgi:hypothetical protein